MDQIGRFFLLSRRELLALTACFVLSLPAVTARFYSADEVQYFAYLRSLWFDRDVSFENEYRYFYDNNIAQSGGFHETLLERQTAAGRRVNYGTIGCALLWAPFYGVADVWARVSGQQADGYSKPYVRAVTYASAFYGFLAILLSIRAARSILNRRPEAGRWQLEAVPAGLAIWFGTPLLFYMYVAPPFAHATSAFAVAVFVTLWLYVRREWTPAGTFALGVCAAVVAMVREQDIFLVLGPAVDFLLTLSTANRQLPTPNKHVGIRKAVSAVIAGVAGFALAYLPQLIAYNALNGYPGPAAHVRRKMYWYSPHSLQVLFSPDHGLLFWTPLAFVALAGLVLLAAGYWRSVTTDVRRIAVIALLMTASQVYIAGSVGSWTVAGAFGQRRFVVLTPLLVLGLAALWGAARERGRLHSVTLNVLIGLCVWWNIALMAQFATGLMDRQRLEPVRNAYHAFVTVPLEAPRLMWRYVANRESFYRKHQKAPQ